jgi:hypothetical protein
LLVVPPRARVRLVRALWFAVLGLVAVGVQVEPAIADDDVRITDREAPLDEVVLKDGSLYRGTLARRTNETVELLLVSGELETFSAADVAYAGPVRRNGDDDEPAEETSARSTPDPSKRVTVRAEATSLSLRSSTEGLTFHLRSGSLQGVGVGGWNGSGVALVGVAARTYEEICTVPCEATLPRARR